MRCFFDLVNGTTVLKDEEGAEVEDVGEAFVEARAAVAEMVESGELAGLTDAWRIQIRDEAGKVLGSVWV